MDKKTLAAIKAGLAAGEALANEVIDPTMSWGDMGAFANAQRKLIRAGRRALAKELG